MEKGFTITYAYGDNLYVNPTNRCNFNCEFCLRHNNSGGSIYTHNLWLKREPTKEEIGEALAVVCRQNNMTMEQIKPYYDAELEAAIVRSVLTGKVMRLIRDAAIVAEE